MYIINLIEDSCRVGSRAVGPDWNMSVVQSFKHCQVQKFGINFLVKAQSFFIDLQSDVQQFPTVTSLNFSLFYLAFSFINVIHHQSACCFKLQRAVFLRPPFLFQFWKVPKFSFYPGLWLIGCWRSAHTFTDNVTLYLSLPSLTME